MRRSRLPSLRFAIPFLRLAIPFLGPGIIVAACVVLLGGCNGGGGGRSVYHRVRYEGEPPPQLAGEPLPPLDLPPVEGVPPAEAPPQGAAVEPAAGQPAAPEAGLPPPAYLPPAPPAATGLLPPANGFPPPAPILPGAQAPGRSDSDPLYFSFLGKETPELAPGGTWINRPDGIAAAEKPTLQSLRGKLVLLQFAFLECPSCALMTPHLARWHEAYGPRGLAVLYVDNGLADRLEGAKTTVAARKIAYPFFHDPEGKTLAAFGVRAFPMAYLIGPDGKVLWEGGPIGIEGRLEELIVKSLP